MIAQLSERAGLKGKLKDAEHIFQGSWARQTRRDGVDINDVRRLWGWESLEMVQHYAETVDTEDALNAYKNRKRRPRP